MAPNKQEPGRYQRWTNRTLAYKLLQQGLQPNGNIDPNMRPKELWESNTEFQKYSLASFRAAFNREKTAVGCDVRDEGEWLSQWDLLDACNCF
jgi:hypothetical protein